MDKPDIIEQINNKYLILEKVSTHEKINVFLVKNKQTDIKYIAKVSKRNDDSFENEINILKSLNKNGNEYIINLIDSGEGEIIRKYKEPKKSKYIILEYAPNESIFDYLYVKKTGFNELYSKIIFHKILKGIQFCHQNNICHRDIKLENILLDENFNPKICDFGCACYNESNLSDNIGTIQYKSPEISNSMKYDGFKADIFNLGEILFLLVTGNLGFNRATKHDPKYNMIMKEKYDEYWKIVESQHQFNEINLSQEFKDLYLKMVEYNPKYRPSIDEILNHPWFNDINNMENINKEKLETELKEEFSKLVGKIKENSQKELKAEDKFIEVFRYNTRTIHEDSMKFFNYDVESKYIYTPINMDYSIKIEGYLNQNEFMNYLCDMLIQKFGNDNCYIEASKDKYKLTIIFEEDTEKEEINDNSNKDIEMNEDEEEESSEINMQLILYKAGEEHILKFINKEGNKKIFWDKFEVIYNIVKDIIC